MPPCCQAPLSTSKCLVRAKHDWNASVIRCSGVLTSFSNDFLANHSLNPSCANLIRGGGGVVVGARMGVRACVVGDALVIGVLDAMHAWSGSSVVGRNRTHLHCLRRVAGAVADNRHDATIRLAIILRAGAQVGCGGDLQNPHYEREGLVVGDAQRLALGGHAIATA